MRGHDAAVRAVAYTPDGTMVVTGSDDKTAALWSHDGFLIRDFKGHEDGVDALAVTPDGAQLVTQSNDHTVRLWNMTDGSLVHLFRRLGFVQAVALTPDGQSLLTGSRDGTVRVLSLDDWDVQQTCGSDSGAINALAVTKNDAWFVTGARGVSVWSLATGTVVRQFKF